MIFAIEMNRAVRFDGAKVPARYFPLSQLHAVAFSQTAVGRVKRGQDARFFQCEI